MKKAAAAVFTIFAIAVIAGCAQAPPPGSKTASPPQISPEARSQLAPTGTLRVAVLTSNPVIGGKNSAGELSGTTVELGRALAASAGVPVRMLEYTAVNKLVEDAALTGNGAKTSGAVQKAIVGRR